MENKSFKVTVVFPCDFENDESSRRTKHDTTYLCRLLRVKSYRYSSAIFSVNQNMSTGIDTDKNEVDVANEILGSCHILEGKIDPKGCYFQGQV